MWPVVFQHKTASGRLERLLLFDNSPALCLVILSVFFVLFVPWHKQLLPQLPCEVLSGSRQAVFGPLGRWGFHDVPRYFFQSIFCPTGIRFEPIWQTGTKAFQFEHFEWSPLTNERFSWHKFASSDREFLLFFSRKKHDQDRASHTCFWFNELPPVQLFITSTLFPTSKTI